MANGMDGDMMIGKYFLSFFRNKREHSESIKWYRQIASIKGIQNAWDGI